MLIFYAVFVLTALRSSQGCWNYKRNFQTFPQFFFLFFSSSNSIFSIDKWLLNSYKNPLASWHLCYFIHLSLFFPFLYIHVALWEQNDIKNHIIITSLINTTTTIFRFYILQKKAKEENAETTKIFSLSSALCTNSSQKSTLCFAFETHKNKNIYFSMVPPAGWVSEWEREERKERNSGGLKWALYIFWFYSIYEKT